ncbi:glucosamine-6-phosphate deaminase [Candidatus Falkowbacteria bacterium]|nr:glucosamine-6-phosphate deaminase [Candidatus Falkowbacteria bacterium]
MKLILCETYDEMSKKGAEIFIEQLKNKPDSVLGLATGSTPVGMYKELIKANKEGEIDFSKVITFNLDEYYKIPMENEQSFWLTMHKNFFDEINIKDENINIPNYQDDDYESFCLEYEKKIKEAGGIDLQVVGIGHNGHVGFNEPGSSFSSRTRKVDLTESTIEANSRFFKNEDEVPKEAITMGMGTIMEAKKIILVVNGEGKAKAVAGAAEGEVNEEMPASVLQKHNDVIFLIEKEAGALLKRKNEK